MDTLTENCQGGCQSCSTLPGLSAELEKTIDDIKHYYGKVLSSKDDLKTTACCTAEAFPQELKDIVSELHPEVVAKSYGCGIPIPKAIDGCTVLDLGCGAGRDVYVLSKLVGQNGKVIGLDMTDEQLEVARRHEDYHMKKWGYTKSNVDLRQGFIEDLAAAKIESDSVDLVISNCVFNLSPAKDRLFSEIIRVLKPGGELYFSDVFADRRIPAELVTDPVLRGECLSGALYIHDFRRLIRSLGVLDYRVVSSAPLAITNHEIAEKLGNTKFTSQTIRLFKLPLEDLCEDYGQAAAYKGTIPGCLRNFVLDDHHVFETGKLVTVCSNTAAMLKDTRFSKHFEIYGDGKTHYGVFPCAPSLVVPINSAAEGRCC